MNAKKPTRKQANKKQPTKKEVITKQTNESSRDERLQNTAAESKTRIDQDGGKDMKIPDSQDTSTQNVYTIKMDDYLKLPNKEDIDIILVKAEENAFDVRVKSFDSDVKRSNNESELRNQLHRMSLQKSQDGEDTQSLKMSAISNNGEKDRNFQKIPHSANDYHISQQQDMVGLTQDNNNKGQQIITRTLREVNHVIIDQESQEKQQSYKNGSNTNGELRKSFFSSNFSTDKLAQDSHMAVQNTVENQDVQGNTLMNDQLIEGINNHQQIIQQQYQSNSGIQQPSQSKKPLHQNNKEGQIEKTSMSHQVQNQNQIMSQNAMEYPIQIDTTTTNNINNRRCPKKDAASAFTQDCSFEDFYNEQEEDNKSKEKMPSKNPENIHNNNKQGQITQLQSINNTSTKLQGNQTQNDFENAVTKKPDQQPRMNLRKRTREVFEGVNYMKETTNQYEIEYQIQQSLYNRTSKARKFNPGTNLSGVKGATKREINMNQSDKKMIDIVKNQEQVIRQQQELINSFCMKVQEHSQNASQLKFPEMTDAFTKEDFSQAQILSQKADAVMNYEGQDDIMQSQNQGRNSKTPVSQGRITVRAKRQLNNQFKEGNNDQNSENANQTKQNKTRGRKTKRAQSVEDHPQITDQEQNSNDNELEGILNASKSNKRETMAKRSKSHPIKTKGKVTFKKQRDEEKKGSSGDTSMEQLDNQIQQNPSQRSQINPSAQMIDSWQGQNMAGFTNLKNTSPLNPQQQQQLMMMQMMMGNSANNAFTFNSGRQHITESGLNNTTPPLQLSPMTMQLQMQQFQQMQQQQFAQWQQQQLMNQNINEGSNISTLSNTGNLVQNNQAQNQRDDYVPATEKTKPKTTATNRRETLVTKAQQTRRILPVKTKDQSEDSKKSIDQ
eukprot:403339045